MMRRSVQIILLCLSLSGLLGSGCSVTQQISEAVNKVRNHATEIRSDVARLRTTIPHQDDLAKEAAVNAILKDIDVNAAEIVAVTDLISVKLPGVEDKTPWWANLLKWALVVVSAGGAVFLLWRFDLLLLAEKLIQKIVDLIAKGLGAI